MATFSSAKQNSAGECVALAVSGDEGVCKYKKRAESHVRAPSQVGDGGIIAKCRSGNKDPVGFP